MLPLPLKSALQTFAKLLFHRLFLSNCKDKEELERCDCSSQAEETSATILFLFEKVHNAIQKEASFTK